MILPAVLGLVGCGGALRTKGNEVRSKNWVAAHCTIALSHSEPLITEWPDSVKLETLLTESLGKKDSTAIAVAFTGCELRILDECRPKADYDWHKTSVRRDTLEIQDANALYSKIPIGAEGLEGTLKRTGRLTVMTTTTGQVKMLGSIDLAAISKNPSCDAATHIVTSVTMGALKTIAVSHGRTDGLLTTETLREAGIEAECNRAASDMLAPGCQSPLQVYLVPIPRSRPATTPDGGSL